MTMRTRTADRTNATLGGWALATVMVVGGVWPISARAQVSVGTSTPGGSKVGMGVISDDPAADAEAERERRQKRFAELINLLKNTTIKQSNRPISWKEL